MGIQGLARRLDPYSIRYAPEELKGYAAIIDGPGLAYEAHKLALNMAAGQLRLPSYADINNAAVQWLHALEDQGIIIAAVLFDGALPGEKQAERLSRTEQNNRRIQQLRASYAAIACPIPTYLSTTSYAFLAPSLREALADSPFASRTRNVPGEADDACALHAKGLSRSIIFTSDSDLLLFDYPPETLIVLFQNAESPVGLKAHSPFQIAQKLQMQSLLPLAYSIQQRSSEGMEGLVRDARILDFGSSMYLDFSRRYTAAVVAPAYLEKNKDLKAPLQALDVRVSEFVHETLMGSLNLPLYLPLLVEDPNQASAWNMAQDVRNIACSLMSPDTAVIREYRRKAQGISTQNIQVYFATDVQVPAKDLEGRISTLVKWAESKDMSPTLIWSLFALSLVVSDLNTPPPILLITRVLNGDFDNTWAFIHLAARLQAALYSLRMLKQITAVWLATNQQTKSKLRSTLESVQLRMANFPSIADMFIVPGQAKRLLANHEHLKELVEEIFKSAGLEVAVEQLSNKKKKRQAREAERKKKKVEHRQQSKAGDQNSFLLLNSGESS
ncbi:XPG domain containing-domain-containing protein [Ampelomyces quisqualis]|uniref:XPG domain containing-domain-containing protein n=1 Tax=Ampelomyces quisqualis TaxID=50730 RepID=A0A6A5QYU7_AMPQU|nr:XPG domain containing-domain-containing protein [Ampelomyces quisqualis]